MMNCSVPIELDFSEFLPYQLKDGLNLDVSVVADDPVIPREEASDFLLGQHTRVCNPRTRTSENLRNFI
jgi:hypothetical protein